MKNINDCSQTSSIVPLVDQHATWLAVNPIHGCPFRCQYCFLNQYSLTHIRPKIVASPQETAQVLLESPFYNEDKVICPYTWTDVFSGAESIKHLLLFLSEYAQRGGRNTIVLVTKCRVSPETLSALQALREKYSFKIIFYLSYSGLDSSLEKGIDSDNIKQNFKLLHDYNFPIVHYWRPFLPSNSSMENLENVISYVSKYATCSACSGLKLSEDIIANMRGEWPDLLKVNNPKSYECVFPEGVILRLNSLSKKYKYPLFFSNSCALSYLEKKQEKNRLYGKHECIDLNNCPNEHRDRCEVLSKKYPVDETKLSKELKKFQINENDYRMNDGFLYLKNSKKISASLKFHLWHECGVETRCLREDDDYYWKSGIFGAPYNEL